MAARHREGPRGSFKTTRKRVGLRGAPGGLTSEACSTRAVPRHPGRRLASTAPGWPPSRGSRPPQPTPRATAGPGERSPAGARRPHGPHVHPAVPSQPPCFSGTECAARSGDPSGQRRPGDDTHMRRGRLVPRHWKRARTVTGAGRGKGRGGATSRRSESLGTGSRAVQGTEKTGAQPDHQENKLEVPPPHTRGQSRDAWDAGWPRPRPEPPMTQSQRVPLRARVHSSVRPRQIQLPSSLTPRLNAEQGGAARSAESVSRQGEM